MIDQVRSLNNSGVSAAILSSNKGIDKDLVATAKEVSSGKYFLLYTAPEVVVEDHCWRINFLLYHRVNLFYIKKPRPDHAQIQSIPGLVGDLAFNWRRIGLVSRLALYMIALHVGRNIVLDMALCSLGLLVCVGEVEQFH